MAEMILLVLVRKVITFPIKYINEKVQFSNIFFLCWDLVFCGISFFQDLDPHPLGVEIYLNDDNY